MGMPYKLTFIEIYGDKENIIDCVDFREPSQIDNVMEKVILTENSMLRVYFDAPAGYKLYVDGFDQLEENFVFEDENGVFIRPGKTAYTLYNPFANKKPYPFIPGTYSLMMHTANGEVLEARAKVITKRITEDQHGIMIGEIEEAVQALSNEANLRNNPYYGVFKPDKVKTYSTILLNRNKIINGLQTIEKNRRYSIEKKYPVSPKLKANKMDKKSLQFMLMYPHEQTIRVPVSVSTYDLLENRWLKTIIQRLLNEVNEMKCYIGQAKSITTSIEKDIISLQNKLTSFLNQHWMRRIQEMSTEKLPTRLLTAGAYGFFFKIHRMIKKDILAGNYAPTIQFTHKRSDFLYELWGYLKVIERLKEAHYFQLKRNHFQVSENATEEQANFIELVKGNCILRVFYNETMPNRKEAITAYRTMFTMSNNTPDCRVDVWKDDQFKGSLIIDFKYRKKEYLWNDDYLANEKPSKVMQQLGAYSTSMKSNSLSINGVCNPLIDAQPVNEVWAVYPIKWEELTPNYDANDYLIRLIDLSPGSEDRHFDELLEDAIQRIIDR